MSARGNDMSLAMMLPSIYTMAHVETFAYHTPTDPRGLVLSRYRSSIPVVPMFDGLTLANALVVKEDPLCLFYRWWAVSLRFFRIRQRNVKTSFFPRLLPHKARRKQSAPHRRTRRM